MLKRTHIRHFLALAETGGFTAAAKRLNITQPTLSNSITELERMVGTRLLLRERRGIQLTEAGSRLLVHARTIETEFLQAQSSAAAAPPGSAPPLRLGVIPTLSTELLAAMSRAYSGQRPLVLTEASDADLRRKLSGGRIEAALTTLPEGVHTSPVLEERYAMLLPEDHPLANRSQVRPEELAGETMIARRSCEILAETSRFFTRHGVRPRFFLRSANDDRCLAMVREGMGITTAPRSFSGPGIIAIDVAGYNFRRSIGLLAAPGTILDGDLAAGWQAARDLTCEALCEQTS